MSVIYGNAINLMNGHLRQACTQSSTGEGLYAGAWGTVRNDLVELRNDAALPTYVDLWNWQSHSHWLSNPVSVLTDS